jgi:hypothetical protein
MDVADGHRWRSTTTVVDISSLGPLDRAQAVDVLAVDWDRRFDQVVDRQFVRRPHHASDHQSEDSGLPARCASGEARPHVPPASAVPPLSTCPTLRMRIGEIALPGWDPTQTSAFVNRVRDQLRALDEDVLRRSVATLD